MPQQTNYDRLRERHYAEFTALLPEHLERLRWPVERIREERERRLRVLLAAARERSSWHAPRLAGVDPAARSVRLRLERLDVVHARHGALPDPRPPRPTGARSGRGRGGGRCREGL